MTEYLVTGQGYDKKDEHKQTILLHESYLAKDINDAKNQFLKTFATDYQILKIYSVVNTAQTATI